MRRLTVLYPTRNRDSSGSIFYVCRCKCGNTVSITRPNRVSSCGCLRADRLRELHINQGEKQGSSILTADDVRTIKALRRLGWLQREIAADFGVARTTINGVLNGYNWRHVT